MLAAMIAVGVALADEQHAEEQGDSMIEDFPLGGLPPETMIDVWRLDLDRPVESGLNLGDILSAEERERAERFVFARDAARFRLCRTMLRIGLAWYLDRAPREIALTTGWRGKPCLAEPSGLYFNVTHCDRLGMIAFTTVGEVGIDAEAVQRDVEALDIARANFTKKEAAMIAAAGTPEEQAIVFLRLWTRKEAVLKADGHGILDGLNTVDVSQLANLVVLRGGSEEVSESWWQVRDMEGIDGFAGAIATRPGDWPVRLWPIRCEDTIRRLAARFPGVLRSLPASPARMGF